MPAAGPELYLTLLEIGLAVATVVGLRFITAPYGRHGRSGWGPTVSSRVGWLVMESVSPLVFLGVYLTGSHRADVVPLVFLGLWQLHYVQRAFVYPFLIRAGARMPLSIVAMAIAFNLLNASINARWVGHLGRYPVSWLYDPRMLAGVLLFLGGLAVNLNSDRILRRLRRPGESGYRIPHGGAYRWVSSPNYLGEMVEWFGWALATWSLPGLAFALYTVANLAPRAIDNHRWYRNQFPDYPPERRALLPGLL